MLDRICCSNVHKPAFVGREFVLRKCNSGRQDLKTLDLVTVDRSSVQNEMMSMGRMWGQ